MEKAEDDEEGWVQASPAHPSEMAFDRVRRCGSSRTGWGSVAPVPP